VSHDFREQPLLADGQEPPPVPSRRAVLLTPVGRPAATSALRLTGQPGWLVPWADDQVLVLGDVPATVAVALVVSDSTAGPVATVVWVDPDDELTDDEPDDAAPEPAAGVVLAHRGSVATAHAWTADGESDADVGDAHLVAELTGRPGAEVGLRALMRRRSTEPASLLPELTALLELPAAPLALLTAPELPAGTDHVAAVTGLRRAGAFRAVLADVPEPGWAGSARRWQFLLPATIAGYFAVRATTAGVTDGPVEDIWGYGTLSVVSTCAAFWRAHRDRRRAHRD